MTFSLSRQKKKDKKFPVGGRIILLCFCSIAGDLQAQNLVRNPGFEYYITCPSAMTNPGSLIPLTDWYSPTPGTPDLFASCSQLDVAVPRNFAGYSYPAEGHNYVGLFIGGPDESEYTNFREYLGAKLIERLQRDSTYILTFYTRPSSYCRYTVRSVTVAFSEDSIYSTDDHYIKNDNYLVAHLDSAQVVNDWYKVTLVFKAGGNEQFMTFGSFLKPGLNQFVRRYTGPPMNEEVGSAAYYLFDDFSLTPEFPVQPYTINEFFSIPKISFETQSADLGVAGIPEVQKLTGFLKQNNQYKLLIVGRSDSKGPAGNRKKLSTRRAMAVKNLMVKQGLEESRIQIQFADGNIPGSGDGSFNQNVVFMLEPR